MTTPHAVPVLLGQRFILRRTDAGILPLLALLPFLYVPKVLEGDTQPWVLIGVVIALFSYRPQQFLTRAALPVVVLAVSGLAAYVARSGLTAEALRAAYMYLTFVALWTLASRGGDYFRNGVRYMLFVWFIVGAFQYYAVLLGVSVEFAGRFVEGRSGVPSLAAEPSYFGSLSVLMIMYLLHDRRRGDGIFIVLGVLNVLLSGSLLATLLLVFPFLYLRMGIKLIAGAGFAGLLLLDATINEAGLTARLAGFQSADQGLVSLLLDPSLNLRFGHIQYSLWENLLPSLVFANSLDFQNGYNQFAAQTGVLIPTESPFIVTMAGELVNGGGSFGLGLIVILVVAAARGGRTFGARLLRGSFAIACLLNPISIANPFFVFFCLQPRAGIRAITGPAHA